MRLRKRLADDQKLRRTDQNHRNKTNNTFPTRNLHNLVPRKRIYRERIERWGTTERGEEESRNLHTPDTIPVPSREASSSESNPFSD